MKPLSFFWIQGDLWLFLRTEFRCLLHFLCIHTIDYNFLFCTYSYILLRFSEWNSIHNLYLCPWVAIRMHSLLIEFVEAQWSVETICDQWVLLLFSSRNEKWSVVYTYGFLLLSSDKDHWRIAWIACQMRSRIMLAILIVADRNVAKIEMKQNWCYFNTGCNLLHEATNKYACAAKLSFLNNIWMTKNNM